MQKLTRQVLNEILWLAFSLGVAILLAFLMFGRTLLNDTLDIHLHDTYFVIAHSYILIPIFFIVTFIVYFIKELRMSYRRTLPNWILISTGLILVIALTFLIKTLSQFFTGDWTLYPPLSALGPDKVPELTQDPATKFLITFFTGMQFAILIMLLFASYRWGRQKAK
jgi:magnesium-transporting ATPase (P-type)